MTSIIFAALNQESTYSTLAMEITWKTIWFLVTDEFHLLHVKATADDIKAI